MKKLLILLLAAFAVACSKDNNGDNGDDFDREAAQRELIGTWQLYVDDKPERPYNYIQFNEGYTLRLYYIDLETGEEKDYANWGPNYSLEKGSVNVEHNSTYRYEIRNDFLYLYPPHVSGKYFLFKKVE